MKSSPWIRRIVALVLACVTTLAGRAYVLRTDESGVYAIKWNRSPVPMEIKLSSAANLIDGTSQRSSVAAAMQAWNSQLGTVQLSPQLSSPGAYSAGNGINEIVMDSTLDGEAFPAEVLAITLLYTRGDDAAETDIVFNTAFTWNSYRGSLRRGTEDIQRIAIHELGHVLGLEHPDEYGQYVTAIMNSRESDLDRLQGDDIAGGQALYGPPGVRPANDAWAGATAIDLVEYSLSLNGSTIGATREAGEPDHAAAIKGHSVWWKWTPANSGSLTVDTFGSNFDTVLAIYTGSSVSALTEVASNDDEETGEQNPTPSRRRTSKVTFNVTGGTTYYVAVDGWGDNDSPSMGYSGAITLNLDFTVVVPLAFVRQPDDVTVAAGDLVNFFATVSGRPISDYGWQRRAGGTGEWKDIADGAVYHMGTGGDVGGGFLTTFHVTTDFAMNGDQFRAVATNPAGTVRSEIAVLHVTRIPLPVITSQPRSRKLLVGVGNKITVEATGAASYQWYRNGAPLAGQTSPLLYFPDPQAADAGDYTVVATNPGGSVSSAKATITVGPPAVIKNLSPTRQVLSVGQNLSLSVSATGTGTLSYQWYHDGRPISGATGASYTRSISSRTDTGAYWVAVTDTMGTRHGPPFFTILSRASTNVVAWGNGYDGQTAVPLNLTDAVAVSAAPSYALALRRGGSVVAWGNLESMQPNFTNAVAVAAGIFGAMALQANGTVVATGEAAASMPTGLKEVWAISSGESFALALKTDGTVESWGNYAPPAHALDDIVAISDELALRRDGMVMALNSVGVYAIENSLADHIVAISSVWVGKTLALKADGTMAWNPAPVNATGLVAIAAAAAHAVALKSNGTVVAWDGSNEYGETVVPPGLGSVFAIAAGGSTSFAIRDISTAQPLLLTAQPSSQSIFLGWPATLFSNAASGTASPPTFQWQRNGREIAGATDRNLTIPSVEPVDAGIYMATIKGGGTTLTTTPVVLGPEMSGKFVGSVSEVGSNVLHPNGNVFDQLLLDGAVAAVCADYGDQQVTRLSFVDLNDDIVQVELSGPGTLSIVLDESSGPAAAVNYHQPDVRYMKGHAGIVVADAFESTNLSVFTVGRATAFDPTGAYNLLLPISSRNDPARNGSPLFTGHEATRYDGVADIAFIAITSRVGQFGGVRTANAHYFATKGLTGIYAPGVQFTGPVYLGDVTAFDAATPVIVLGSTTAETRIAGGDLLQDNGRAVQVSGLTKLKFSAGTDSQGRGLPAQKNRAVLQQNGRDVTTQIVENPQP